MSDKRRGLGRGLGALIPSGGPATGSRSGTGTVPPAMRPAARPIDVFFDQRPEVDAAEEREERVGDLAVVTTDDGDTRDGAQDDTPPQKPQKAASATRKTQKAGKVAAGTSAAEVAPQALAAVDGAVRDDSAAEASAGAVESQVAGQQTGVEVSVEAAPSETSPGDLVEVPGARFAEIPVSSITPNPRQPRTVFDEDDLAELVHSIREIGVLQPIVVRQVDPADDGSARFELVMGERRWRATTEAGFETIPAIVRETTDDDLLRDALLENLHRSQLNPLEEAAAYQQLLDDFGCTHEELASRIGRSRPQISNTLRLMKLPPLVQRRVAAGVISAGHARALLSLEDGAAMERLAQRVVAEGLSVRAVEEMIALGDADAAPRRRNPTQPKPELDNRASTLADRLDTRVRISMGRTRGRLTVDFAGMDDLDRILRLLDSTAPA